MADSLRVLQARLDDLQDTIEERDERIAALEKRLDDADSAGERQQLRREIDREEQRRDDVEDDADDLIERLRRLGVDVQETSDDDAGDDKASDDKAPPKKRKIKTLPKADDDAGDDDKAGDDKGAGDDHQDDDPPVDADRQTIVAP